MKTLAACAIVTALPLAGVLPARADQPRQRQQWVLNTLDVPAAWRVTQGNGVVVAVIDSGADPSVSDLTGSVVDGPDYTGVSTPSSNPNWGVHGTWMASLIAGHGHGRGARNGILGVAPRAKILSIRVITDRNDPGYGRYQAQAAWRGQRELARGIRYAVRHGAGVISMSLGYNESSLTVRSALQYALNHNVVVVASSGNSGTSHSGQTHNIAPYSFPADYPGVIGVAAVTPSGQPAYFSSENLSVSVAAPGVGVPAQGRGSKYWVVSGTSPACALTAGVAALIKAKYPKLTAAQVRSALTRSTTNRPHRGYNDHVGFGTVDAAAALRMAGRLAGQAPGGSTPAGKAAAAGNFGNGQAGVPAFPVPPRGRHKLLVLLGIGLGCLLLVIIAFALLIGGRRKRRMARQTAQARAVVPPVRPGTPGAGGVFAAGPIAGRVITGEAVAGMANADGAIAGGAGAHGTSGSELDGHYPTQIYPAQPYGQAVPIQGYLGQPGQGMPVQGYLGQPGQAQPGQFGRPLQAGPAQQPGQFGQPAQAGPAQQLGQFGQPLQAGPTQDPGQFGPGQYGQPAGAEDSGRDDWLFEDGPSEAPSPDAAAGRLSDPQNAAVPQADDHKPVALPPPDKTSVPEPGAAKWLDDPLTSPRFSRQNQPRDDGQWRAFRSDWLTREPSGVTKPMTPEPLRRLQPGQADGEQAAAQALPAGAEPAEPARPEQPPRAGETDSAPAQSPHSTRSSEPAMRSVWEPLVRNRPAPAAAAADPEAERAGSVADASAGSTLAAPGTDLPRQRGPASSSPSRSQEPATTSPSRRPADPGTAPAGAGASPDGESSADSAPAAALDSQRLPRREPKPGTEPLPRRRPMTHLAAPLRRDGMSQPGRLPQTGRQEQAEAAEKLPSVWDTWRPTTTVRRAAKGEVSESGDDTA